MQRKPVWLLLVLILILTSCGPGKIFGPTITSSPSKTSTPTYSPTPTLTFTPTFTPTPSSTPTPTLTPIPLGQFVTADKVGNLVNINLWDETGVYIRTLSTFTPENAADYSVRWSPNGEYLLATGCYSEGKSGRSFCDLYVISLQDGQAVRIARRVNYDSVWSPDGEMIAYSAPLPATDNNADIYIYHVRSSQTERFTKNAADNWFPIFSPDGKNLFYWYHGSIHIASLDGLTNNTIFGIQCWWGEYDVTPDGKRVVYSDLNGEMSDIYMIDVDGKNKVQLTTVKYLDDRLARGFQKISSDGNYVLYYSYGYPNYPEGPRDPSEGDGDYISVAPLDGSQPILLGTGDGWNAHWSLDGQYVIFQGWLGKKRSSDRSPEEYFAVRPDGTGAISLSEKVYKLTENSWRLNYLSNNLMGYKPFEGSTVTPTATAWPIKTGLVMYDDFSSETMDMQRWNKTTWNVPESAIGSYLSYRIMNSRLFLEVTSPANQTSGLDLEMSQEAGRSIDKMKAVEAKFYLMSGSHGTYSDVHLRINTTIANHLWWTQCRLAANQEGTAGTLICEVMYSINGPQQEFQTIEEPIKFSNWYTVRIEIDPQSGALQFYLDGELIEQYLPQDAKLLLNAKFTPIIGANAGSGSVDAFVDDVQIEP